MSDDVIDKALETMIREGKVIRDGDIIRENPFYIYVKGLSRMKLGSPKGVHLESHLAKRFREVRNGARLLAGDIDGHG
jgi:hypothetical protein